VIDQICKSLKLRQAMQHNKTTILLSLLLLCSFACTEDIPDFELGRYEYAGIDDSKSWRFFRVENNGVYREVTPKATGLGELKQISFCHEDLFGERFYDCGLYPNFEKPFFNFTSDQVEIALLDYSPSKIIKITQPYRIEGDSIYIGTTPNVLKYPRPQGAKKNAIEIGWRIAFARGAPFSLELVKDQLTEQERLHQIALKEKLSVGDTLVYLLFKERYVKQ